MNLKNMMYNQDDMMNTVDSYDIDTMDNDQLSTAIEYLSDGYVYLNCNEAQEGILVKIRNAIINMLAKLFSNLTSYSKIFSGYVKRSEAQVYRQSKPMVVRTVEQQPYSVLAEKNVPTFQYSVGPMPLSTSVFALIDASDIQTQLKTLKGAIEETSKYVDSDGVSMQLFKYLSEIKTPKADTKAMADFYAKTEAKTNKMSDTVQFSDYFNSVESFKGFAKHVGDKAYSVYNDAHDTAACLAAVDKSVNRFLTMLDDNDYWVKENGKSIKLLADIISDIGKYTSVIGALLKQVNVLDHFVADTYPILYNQIK